MSSPQAWRPHLAAAETREKLREGASPLRLYSVDLLSRLLPLYARDATVVCEVGSAHGSHARFVPSRARYVGVDIVRPAAWSGEPRPSTVAFVQGRGEALPLRDASVDMLFTSSTLEHVDDVTACLAEFARVLAPGRPTLHIVPGESSRFLYGRHGHRRFDPVALRAQIRAAGFRSERLWSLGGLASFLLHFLAITVSRDRGRRRAGPYARALRWCAGRDSRWLRPAIGYALLAWRAE